MTYEVMSEDEIIAAFQARLADGRRANHVYGEAPACATPAHIDAAEKIIGFPLPPLLRRIYLEVANGGLGPFGGIEGLPPDGYTSDGDMLEGYDQWHTVELGPNEPPPPPRGVIFLCDFGCAMWAMLDCRHPQGQMWWSEEGEQDRYKVTLAEWLSGWLEDGRNVLDDAEIDVDGESWHYPDTYWNENDDYQS